MNDLKDFVAARMAEEDLPGPVRDVDGAASRAPLSHHPGGRRTLLDDYADTVHLTQRWVALELAVRDLANRSRRPSDFNPRWRIPDV